MSVEFGDFQTPPALAMRVVERLQRLHLEPNSILEPTCGVGNLLMAVLMAYPNATGLGLEINAEYAARAAELVGKRGAVRVADFFAPQTAQLRSGLSEPVLVIGNPPWVTSAAITASGGTNLPQKSNSQGLRGVEARTGKSNFDISESILLSLLEGIQGTDNALCMIVKTSVARKVLRQVAQRQWRICDAQLCAIDAKQEFAAAVDASVLMLRGTRGSIDYRCAVYASLEAEMPLRVMGMTADGQLIADADAYQRSQRFLGSSTLEWRSGIKHDCSSVMELSILQDGRVENGLGEQPTLELDHLYPMLKSSDLGNGRLTPRLMMLVPQTFIGEATHPLAQHAPLTWNYLNAHRERLAQRGSSIYLNNPEFSIFGVGAYSFSTWKVAISGMYKRLEFAIVGPVAGQPVVFDDTCYFLPCETEAKTRVLHAILQTTEARDALNALIFWDEKRPITKDKLGRLDLHALARVTRDRLLPDLAAQATPDQRAELEAEFGALTRGSLADVPLFALR